MKIRIGVFFGGRSVEHEVSVISAMQAIAALDPARYDVVPVYITKDDLFYTGAHLGDIKSFKDIPAALETAARVVFARDGASVKAVRYPPKKLGTNIVAELDVALPVVHGTNTEDGALQGFFEYLGLPYAFCDVAASAAGMDKWTMKALFQAAEVPSLPARHVRLSAFYDDTQAELDRIERAFAYPVVVKPVNLGSSVGIGKAADRAALEAALEDALTYAHAAIVEPCVGSLREINCSVLGDADGARASVCEEPLGATDILSFADKYQGQGKGAKGGMRSLARAVPADIPPALAEKARALAIRAFHAIGACGAARVDFLYDTAQDELYVNEINTIPGSLAFYLWEASGLSFPALLDELVALAFKRAREKARLNYTFEGNLLSGTPLGGAKGVKGKLGAAGAESARL